MVGVSGPYHFNFFKRLFTQKFTWSILEYLGKVKFVVDSLKKFEVLWSVSVFELKIEYRLLKVRTQLVSPIWDLHLSVHGVLVRSPCERKCSPLDALAGLVI